VHEEKLANGEKMILLFPTYL